MWFGNQAHGLMSDYLHLLKNKQITEKNIEHIKKNLINEMDEIFEKSKVKQYETYDKNNKFGLSEHFYGQNVDEKFAKWKENILEYFQQFLESDLHNKIMQEFSDATTIFVEPKKPNFESMKLTIKHIPMLEWITLRAQPDLGIILPSEKKWTKAKYIIYDWKTWRTKDRKPDEVSEQLKVYAYKMLLNLGLDKFDEVEIECYEVYLKTMQIFGGKVVWQDIYDIEQKISLDVMNQKKYIHNGDVIKNQPLPTEYFSRTDSPNKCEYCTFRKVCKELKNYEEGNKTLLS